MLCIVGGSLILVGSWGDIPIDRNLICICVQRLIANEKRYFEQSSIVRVFSLLP